MYARSDEPLKTTLINQFIMKKIALLAVVAGALVMSSCNNSEKKDTTATDSAQTVGEHVDAAIADLKNAEENARLKAEQAKKDLDEAIAKGDKAAEEKARAASEEANTAWKKPRMRYVTPVRM